MDYEKFVISWNSHFTLYKTFKRKFERLGYRHQDYQEELIGVSQTIVSCIKQKINRLVYTLGSQVQ